MLKFKVSAVYSDRLELAIARWMSYKKESNWG